MKKKIKVGLTKFPPFENFINKKLIENIYDCCHATLRRKIFIKDNKIKVLCEALIEVDYNNYSFRTVDREEFPLTTVGYYEMQMYIHRYELSEKIAIDPTIVRNVEEVFSLFNEYEKKLKEIGKKYEEES